MKKIAVELSFIAAAVSCFVAAGCFVGLENSAGDDAGGPVDGGDAGQIEKDGGAADDGGTQNDPCMALGHCECLAQSATCEIVSDGCLCDCECYPTADCACDCGGGTFLGCRKKGPVAECPDDGTCVAGVLPPGPIATGTRCAAPHDDLYVTGPACTPAGGSDGFCCTPESTCYVIGAPYLTCCGAGGAETSPQCALGEFYCPDGYEKAEPGSCEKPPCEGLEFCACSHRDDCAVQARDCICPCDYSCPGEPPCDCACGGGEYLGCALKTGTCKAPATDCAQAAPVQCPGAWACSDASFCGYRCDAEPYCLYMESGDRACAAPSCALDKFYTSGMTEGFGIGKRCDFLVVCASTPIEGELRATILAAFPAMTCGGAPDYTCAEDAVASCIAMVGTLGEAQAEDACRLSNMDAVTGLVCAGDL